MGYDDTLRTRNREFGKKIFYNKEVTRLLVS